MRATGTGISVALAVAWATGCVEAKEGGDRLDASAVDASGASSTGGPSTTGGPISTSADGAAGATAADSGPDGTRDARADAQAGPCQEGSMRCADRGSRAREVCEGGMFVAGEPCAEGQVCDSRPSVKAGACAPLGERCVGNAGEYVCAGAELHSCSADSVDIGSTTCESDRHCQTGIALQRCATCIPGTYQCDETSLQHCLDDGSGWETEKECATAALCNAEARACTSQACLPGGKTCEGDTLLVCNASQTGYVEDTVCGMGLCDPADLECDACSPDARVCNDANDGYRTCNTQGQAWSNTPCPLDEPYCVGAGNCVQCTVPGQCSNANPCTQATCNAGSCGSQNRARGTGSCTPATATSGVCDGSGGCIECVTSGDDCPPASPYCVDDMCRPCSSGSCDVGTSCARDGDCASGDCREVCRPVCADSCGLGEQCARDGDCESGSCTDGNCEKVCATLTLIDVSDYQYAQGCSRIEGDLEISGDLPVTDKVFPNLVSVSGSILWQPGSEITSAGTLSFPALAEIGVKMSFIFIQIEEIDMPELVTVGSGATGHGIDIAYSIDDGGLRRFNLRSLQTVQGNVRLEGHSELLTANFQSIQTVTGVVELAQLPQLSWSQVEELYEAGSTSSPDPSDIGCCRFGAVPQGCESAPACP